MIGYDTRQGGNSSDGRERSRQLSRKRVPVRNAIFVPSREVSRVINALALVLISTRSFP
jgi:hypothetical protein